MNIFQQIASTVKGWVSPPEKKEVTVNPAQIQNLNRQFASYSQTQRAPMWNPAGSLATQIVNNTKAIEAPSFRQSFAKSFYSLTDEFQRKRNAGEFQDSLQKKLDILNGKYPNLGNNVRATSDFLGKVDTFLTSPNSFVGKTPIGWAGRMGKEQGFKAADSATEGIIEGVKQIKSQTPSRVPFTNWEVPANVAGSLKMGFGAFNVTPIGMKIQFASDTVQGLAEKKWGKDSIVPPLLGMGATFLVPGGASKNLKNAETIAAKLEGSGGKLTTIKKLFSELPREKRLEYLMAKFSPADLKLSAAETWAKIEGIEKETEKTSNVFNSLFAKWVAGRDMAKTRGVGEALSIETPKGVTGETFLNRLENTISKSTPEVEKAVSQIRTKLDTLHTEAKSAGIQLGYLENYAPHMWRQSKEEVEAIFKSAGKFKHAGERKIPTYAEGIELGLTPLYTDVRQIVGLYSQRLSEARANIKFVQELKSSKFIASGADKLSGWVQVTAEGFPKFVVKTGTKTTEGNFFASPEVAQVLNNVFGVKTYSGTEKFIKGAANVSGKLQDFTLSGGIPKTPFNAWSLAQYFFKEVPAGRLTGGPKALYHSMVDSEKYFETNLPFIQKMQAANIPMNTTLTIENIGKNLFRNIDDVKGMDKVKTIGDNVAENWKKFNLDNPGIGSKIETVWNQAMNETTFKKFMPALQIEFWKDTYFAMLKSGKVEAEASRIASAATKNFYGITATDTLAKKSELGRNILSTIMLAPKYRETMVNFLWNTAKSVAHPLSPEYAANRNFIIGKVLQYAMYDQVNQQTTGNHIWNNPEGYKDKILIRGEDGYTTAIPFDSSILTVPRLGVSVAGKLVEGDAPGALAKTVSVGGSTLISPFADIFRNKDYFDREIVKTTDTVEEKAKKSFMYLLGRWNHPYIREMIDPRSKDDPLYQRLTRASEIPVKYYTNKSIDSAPYFNNLKQSMNSLSPEERAIVQKNSTVNAEKKLKLDEDGTPSNATNLFEKMSKAAERLAYPNLIKAETEAQLKTYQQTGDFVSPYYFLAPEQQKVIELLKTFYPGDPEKAKIIKVNDNWIQSYYTQMSLFYDYMKASGKYGDVIQESGAPIMTAELKTKVNFYFTLPTGTGAKATYLMQNPEVQKYFTDNANWKNAQRMELGLSLLPEYGNGYGSGGSKAKKVSSFTKISVPSAKVVTRSRIAAPKLNLATFKSPLETYNAKSFLSGFKTKQ